MEEVFSSGVLCPKCGREITVKDNERFSSALCACRIILYYYPVREEDLGRHLEISREEYLEWKKSVMRRRNA